MWSTNGTDLAMLLIPACEDDGVIRGGVCVKKIEVARAQRPKRVPQKKPQPKNKPLGGREFSIDRTTIIDEERWAY